MKYLQKLGKSIMLPVACLPLCGILMGIGVGMSDDQNGTAGITALVSWLIITSLLRADFARTILPALEL